MENTCEIFTKDGQRAIDAKSIASLTKCVMDLPQTKVDHVSKDGQYTDSRKKLHAEIIKEFKEGVVCIDKGKPIAVLMGGSPASGKSTFLKKYRPYLLTDNLFKVDADEIRAKLPEYKGWNAAQTHEETGDIVKTLISDKNIGVPCKFDFIYDGTMTSTKKYLGLIELLKEEGYQVFVVFISNIPKKVVKKRALERYQKSGRFVPLAVVDDFYENGEKTFDQVKSKVDGFIVVDGSNFDYNVIEKGGKSLPNKRLYEKLGHKLKFDEGGSISKRDGEGLWYVTIHYYDPNAKTKANGVKSSYWHKIFNVEAKSRDEAYKKATDLYNSSKSNKGREIELISGFLKKPKVSFALGGAVGDDYHSFILSDSQNKSLNKVLQNPIFKDAKEIDTFESGGGFVHTMVLLTNGHVVTFNHEDDILQYSYFTYDSLEEYLSEETAADGEKGWDNEMYTPNAGIRETEISRPTTKFFETWKRLKDPEAQKELFAKAGYEFIPYKDSEIMHVFDGDLYYANEEEFTNLKDAQKYIDSGETSDFIKGAYERGLFKDGGKIAKENNQMFESQIVEAKHHTTELDNVVNSKTEIEPWVLAKMTRAKTDLSDLTHYLDGQSKTSLKKFAGGGNILDEHQEEQFQEWMDDGNVIEREKGVYSTQDAQYSNRLRGLNALKKYFKKEFLSDSYEGGGNIQWSEAKIGDMANVIAENRSGVIMKDYGRKFHVKFADGSEKTYDASELNFYRFDDEEYAKGGMTEHGLKIGDEIMGYTKDVNELHVVNHKNNDDWHSVDLDDGKRYDGGGDVKGMDWFTMWNREGLQVEIGAFSNEDFDDYDEREMEFKRVPVKSIDEAVKVVKNFISQNDLGVGEFIGGQIYRNGKPIAYVSYNLKVWEGKIGNRNSEPYQYMSGGKVHFKPSDFYKLGGSIENMTPVEAYFSQLDYSLLPIGFANYVKEEILTDPQLEAISENDPIFIEIKSKVNSLMGINSAPLADENKETQEAIDLLNELAVDQEGAEKQETLEAIELLKELLV